MKRMMLVALLLPVLGAAATWPKVGPNFKRPQAKVPDSYGQQANAAGTSADPAVAKWWATLGDPELMDLVDRAVHANLDLKIASSRILEARAAHRVSRSATLPSVSSGNSVQRVRGGLTSGLQTPFESNVFQFGFDSSWELDLFGGRRRAVEAAGADLVATEEARRDILVSLLAEVARNYAELRGVQRRMEITHQNIDLQQDSLELTRVRADAGLATQLDVERQAAQLHLTRSIVPALEAAQMQTIHRLGVLLGQQPGELLQELVQVKPLPVVPPVVPVGLPGDLLRRRPDIREAEAHAAAETARVGVAKADLFPKIMLNGAAARQGTDSAGLTLGAGNFFSFGPSITLPIFNSGRIKGNIEAQKQRLEQALTAYQNAVLHSLEEAENSLVAYGREQERRDRLVAAVEASRQATQMAQELYTRGLSDFLSVLDAQRQQLAAADDLARSDTAIVTNLVALYKALGGGWEAVPNR